MWIGIVVACGGHASADLEVKQHAMRTRIAWCKERIERARKDLARSDAAVANARTVEEKGALVLRVHDQTALRMVTVGPTSPNSPARNNWNPPRNSWVDLPIIDKTYSTQKLNLFRFGDTLEGSITAYRGDDSPRAPPVPAWLRPFVEAFRRAVEECLEAS
jgi:hypothetical protein